MATQQPALSDQLPSGQSGDKDPAYEGSIVAHVVVVGFHAKLGNRIEFAYPRLRGDPILRSPKVTDTSDISSDASTPTLANHRRHLDAPLSTPPLSSGAPTSSPQPQSTPSSSAKRPQSKRPPPSPSTATPEPLPLPTANSWGTLPDEWSFLPFMALPDGVHDHSQDIVYFTLPPDVHCVSHFRQLDSNSRSIKSHSAATTLDRGVAARGSVQKSIVLLCRRPLYGILTDRLIPIVRQYFEQDDFADTTVLSSLYHSLNKSLLTRPSLLSSSDILFHGLDLKSLLLKLGGIQFLSIIKLILLERRVILYSQPCQLSSNAIISLISIFTGALDAITNPKFKPLDLTDSDRFVGFPLSLFNATYGSDRIVLQPYAPLPLLSQLIPNHRSVGCLIGTSHNVGILLSSTAAAHAKKLAAAQKEASMDPGAPAVYSSDYESGLPDSAVNNGKPVHKVSQSRSTPEQSKVPHTLAPLQTSVSSNPKLPSSSSSSSSAPPAPNGSGGVPVVDALINLSSGRVSVAAALEPLCRVTAAEKVFMRDLVTACSRSDPSSASYIGSNDHIRERLRNYILRFLKSVSSVPGALGGPAGGETWSAEMVADLDLTPLTDYNDAFAAAWLRTRNAAQWARSCRKQPATQPAPPPRPQFPPDPDAPPSGLATLRKNVEDFSRFSTFVSNKAVEGLSGFFKRFELEYNRIDTAVDKATHPHQEVSKERVSARTSVSYTQAQTFQQHIHPAVTTTSTMKPAADPNGRRPPPKTDSDALVRQHSEADITDDRSRTYR